MSQEHAAAFLSVCSPTALGSAYQTARCHNSESVRYLLRTQWLLYEQVYNNAQPNLYHSTRIHCWMNIGLERRGS